MRRESPDGLVRCGWSWPSELLRDYHDREWGVPVDDDRDLWEHLVLDGFQAGLSWAIVLKKREAMRAAFDGFDPERVAAYGARQINRLLKNPGIVRNRAKVNAAVGNARAFLELREREGSFAEFLWRFVDGAPRRNRWRTVTQLPAETRQSQAMSRALYERGFRFVGPTICYAFMQAAGLVNDHLVTCFRHDEVAALRPERL